MKTLMRLLAVTGMLFLLAACEKSAAPESSAPAANVPSTTFKILAGSELKDVQNMVQEYGRTQNINVVFEFSGTLDAVDRLKETHAYDAVWLSNGKYLQMQPTLKGQIKASEKIMYSPVVLGVKSTTMQKLGWKSGKTGWTDILQAAKAGQFRFAMTNPAGSNTGFVALVGLAAELSGKGDALEEKDIPADKLKDFFSAQTMTAGSSGILAEMFVANPRVDGIINYESVIRSMPAQTGVEVLVPKEGVITADYPLMQLAQSKQGEFYTKLVTWLRSESTQKQIATSTNRTPLSGSGRTEVINELPFPASLNVVDALLQGFLDNYSRPASSYFVLDVSGSMNGARLDAMKDAMLSLANGDGSTGGRFASLRAREQIHIQPFSNEPHQAFNFELTQNREKNLAALSSLSSEINRLKAGGGTAIFTSVASQYKAAQDEMRKEERSVSIVLLTDGENTDGMRLEEFRDFIAKMGVPKVPIFAILYGDAKQSEMTELATLSGGRMFDARKVKLPQVMRDIRNYQ